MTLKRIALFNCTAKESRALESNVMANSAAMEAHMVCSKCSADNPSDKNFCGECGAALVAAAPVLVAGEDGAWYCAKHKKTVTRLRCGRCETPICTKCTVFSPAGIRCRACSRNRIAVRPGGVIHAAGQTLGDVGSRYGNRVWYIALWYFILSLFGHGE